MVVQRLLHFNGKPDASFDYEEIDCGIFTFTNTSTSGELVEIHHVQRFQMIILNGQIFKDGIDASPGDDYNILNGALRSWN